MENVNFVLHRNFILSIFFSVVVVVVVVAATVSQYVPSMCGNTYLLLSICSATVSAYMCVVDDVRVYDIRLYVDVEHAAFETFGKKALNVAKEEILVFSVCE